MTGEFLFSILSDYGTSISSYKTPSGGVSIWGKIGAAVFEIGDLEDVEDFASLLQEAAKLTNPELKKMNKPHIRTEDAFITDEEGWITLPGGQGKVSPDGIMYDSNGVELFTLYEDTPSNVRVFDQDENK